MKAGATVQRTDCASSEGVGMPKHSWSHVPAEKFVVRQKDYAAQKQKAASADSYYELVDFDWYRAERRLARIGDALELPASEFSHPLLPSLLVINVQLPSEGPKMFSAPPGDGLTLHAVFYFALREETVRALDDLDSAEPSLRLLVAYFSRAESEPAVRKRFKALGIVNNLDVVNMRRLIGPFNGKPVLITESGSIFRGSRAAGGSGLRSSDSGGVGLRSGSDGDASQAENDARDFVRGGHGAPGGAHFAADEFLELDINVRQWSFLARKVLQKIEPRFGMLNASIAFLVEGRQDNELPERVLGCATLNALDSKMAREFRV